MFTRPESLVQNVVTKVDLEHHYAPSSFAPSPLYGWTCLNYLEQRRLEAPWVGRTTRALWQIDNALLGWRLQEVRAREPWSSLELPSCFHPYPDGCWSVAPDHDRRLAARTCCACTRVSTEWISSWGSEWSRVWDRNTRQSNILNNLGLNHCVLVNRNGIVVCFQYKYWERVK